MEDIENKRISGDWENPEIIPYGLPGGGKTALVVFIDNTEVGLLRFLKPGFRHCFVILGGRHGWVFLNPLLHRTELEWIDGYDHGDAAALTGFYRRLGYTVLQTAPLDPPRWTSLPLLHSCVEVVKRVLGVNACWVWTPWQLYCHLKKNQIDENNP